MADLHPEFATYKHREDYAALAITAMAATGKVMVGEAWSQAELCEEIGVSQYMLRGAIGLLRTNGWIQTGSVVNRPSDTMARARALRIWQPTEALYNTVLDISTNLLQARDISSVYVRTVRAHMGFEAANSPSVKAHSRAVRLMGVSDLTDIKIRPSDNWFAGRVAWDALVQIVAHNHDWMATNQKIDLWLEHVQMRNMS